MPNRQDDEVIGNRITYDFAGQPPPDTQVLARPMRTPRLRVQTLFDSEKEPSLTQQHMAPACDINNIMAKYQRTGAIDHATKYEGRYFDVPAIDYQEALEQIRTANGMFAELPATLRAEFNHDPATFLSFIQSDPSRDDLERLGLVPRVEPDLAPAPPSEPPA